MRDQGEEEERNELIDNANDVKRQYNRMPVLERVAYVCGRYYTSD